MGRSSDNAVRTLSHDAMVQWTLREDLFIDSSCLGSVAERLACWTQLQKGLVSNRSRNAVG